jgi:uncharacterized protein (DUF1684 family)
MSALHRRRLLASISGAVAVGLAGCGGDSGYGPDTEPENGRDTEPITETRTPTATEMGSGTARVRVAHMSPDAPDIATSVDGDIVPASLGVPFGGVGDYAEVPSGTRQLTITELNDDGVFLDREVTFEPADYTFVAAGEVIDAEPEFRVLPFVDDNSDPGGSTARLRVLHVSPDAGPVDVTVGRGPTLFEGLEFTDGGYVPVEAGDYTVQVRPGTTNGDDEIIYDRDVSLDGGTVYTVFASGYLDVEFASDASFELIVVRDAVL